MRRKTPSSPRIRAQIAEGLRWLAGHRLLRVIAVLLGIYNFANQMGQAVLVLLATQTLHVSAPGYGLLLAASAVGSVIGGLVNPILTRRLGMLPSLVLPALVDAAAFVGIGLAPGPAVVAVLLAARDSPSPCGTWSPSASASGSSPVTCSAGSTASTACWAGACMPLGALAGGFVAHAAGLRAPYIVAGLLCGLSALAALPLLVAATRHQP